MNSEVGAGSDIRSVLGNKVLIDLMMELFMAMTSVGVNSCVESKKNVQRI